MVYLAISTRWGIVSGAGELTNSSGVNLLSFYALGMGPFEETQLLIWGQWPVDNCDKRVTVELSSAEISVDGKILQKAVL